MNLYTNLYLKLNKQTQFHKRRRKGRRIIMNWHNYKRKRLQPSNRYLVGRPSNPIQKRLRMRKTIPPMQRMASVRRTERCSINRSRSSVSSELSAEGLLGLDGLGDGIDLDAML